ncbi:NDR1/HIN1-like protein 13 [Miscanthus floridulus]|uniref:NDR1/HIN1-like protein 13 n=1 Tax=Miscanthus floridulus TaxID=154761 RepID=UPI0034578B9D
MADRVHPMPSPSSSPLPPPPGRRRPDHHHHQQSDADPDPAAAPATDETTPLHPSFFHDRPLALSPPPGTYIIQVPKDQVLRSPPPDRARRYKKLAGRPARRRRLRRACCLSCAALLAILAAAAAFAGAVFLIFRPRAPSFSVPSSLSIRGLDATALASPPAAGLSPALDAAVRADNGRNGKVGVEYRAGGDVAVSYAGQRLAAGPWPAFRQAPRNVTVVAAAIRGQGVRLTDAQRRQLAADRAARAVPLTVEARVPVRLRFGKVLRTWTVDVKVRCEVAVDRLDGNAAVVNRGCRVRVKPLWWWW